LRKQTANAEFCGDPQVPFWFWMMGKISKNLESLKWEFWSFALQPGS